MIARIRIHHAYYLNNEWCQVLSKDSHPWMPDTVKLRYSNGQIKEVRAKTFREQATEARA